MILVDLNQVMISNLMAQNKGNLSELPSKDAVRHSILNTIRAFNAGCNLVLHCNGNMSQMEIIGKNSPFINNFIIKKTSQFYKILR